MVVTIRDMIRSMFAAKLLYPIYISLALTFPVASDATAQEVGNLPEVIKNVSFSDVLKGLADQDISSLMERNRVLSKAVDERGVGFSLSPNARRVIKEAGGSELLFVALERGQDKRTETIIAALKELRTPKDQSITDHGRKIQAAKDRFINVAKLFYALGDRDLLVGKEFEWRELRDWAEKAFVSAGASLTRLLRATPGQ